MPKLSTKDLAAKIEWEGGIWDTLMYGLDPDEIEDPLLASLWATLSAQAFLLNLLEGEFDQALEDALRDERGAPHG